MDSADGNLLQFVLDWESEAPAELATPWFVWSLTFPNNDYPLFNEFNEYCTPSRTARPCSIQ